MALNKGYTGRVLRINLTIGETGDVHEIMTFVQSWKKAGDTMLAFC